MKYLIIPSTEGDMNSLEASDMLVAELSEAQYTNYVEDSWDRGMPPPIVVPLKEFKKVIGMKPLTYKQLTAHD